MHAKDYLQSHPLQDDPHYHNNEEGVDHNDGDFHDVAMVVLVVGKEVL